jgi:hypothetical protein
MQKMRAETNLKLKREAILNPTSKAVSTNAEYRLNQLTSNKRPTPPSKSKRPCKQRKCNYPVKTNKLEMFHSTTKPKDGQLFTLQKAVKNYKENGILPRENSDGMKVGRPPLIEKENIQQLNNNLHNNVGLVGGLSSLTQDILELSNQQRIVRGIDTSFEKHTISSATKKLYNHEASISPTRNFSCQTIINKSARV